MEIKLSASLICSDLCNLEQSVKEIDALGIDMLHIDLIDGYFSPSMPLGLDMLSELRQKTDIPFDVHIMAEENAFFIDEMIKIGVQQICFHYESEVHVDWVLNKIRKSGIKAGVALTPSTQISVLDYVVESCDFVMLMLINPGFAGNSSEQQVPYAIEKIRDCRKLIKRKGLNTLIEIDGRITTDKISEFVLAGSNILVLGSSSLFSPNAGKETNLLSIRKAVAQGIERCEKDEIG